MADRYLEILGESSNKRNYIPSGRQLPRTPPLMDIKRQLDFSSDDLDADCENMQPDPRDFNTPETKTEHISITEDPQSMLKAMKGYQLIPSDWEFIEQMKEEKLVKKLQRDLEELQRLLKKEVMAAELVFTSREKAQAELKTLPSCEELAGWVKVVLRMTTSTASTELTDLDTKSLLTMVTEDNIRRVINEKRAELAQMVANKNKKAKESEQLEKQIASQQHEVLRLMSQLSDLKSALTQEEEAFQDHEMQIKAQKAPVEAEVDTSEELQATKSQRQGKQRKKAVKSTEKFEDAATNQSKSTRSKLTDSKANNQTSVRGETLKTKQKSGAAAEKQTKPVKAARGPQKKVKEKESNPQEPEQTVRGRRKAAVTAQTATSQPKNQSPMKTGQKAAGEEAQNTGLRRSKRIASRM